jgi:hypothetical protein
MTDPDDGCDAPAGDDLDLPLPEPMTSREFAPYGYDPSRDSGELEVTES